MDLIPEGGLRIPDGLEPRWDGEFRPSVSALRNPHSDPLTTSQSLSRKVSELDFCPFKGRFLGPAPRRFAAHAAGAKAARITARKTAGGFQTPPFDHGSRKPPPAITSAAPR